MVSYYVYSGSIKCIVSDYRTVYYFRLSADGKYGGNVISKISFFLRENKNICWSNKSRVEKILGQNNLWPKKSLAEKLFGGKNLWPKKSLAEKIFRQKNL